VKEKKTKSCDFGSPSKAMRKVWDGGGGEGKIGDCKRKHDKTASRDCTLISAERRASFVNSISNPLGVKGKRGRREEGKTNFTGVFVSAVGGDFSSKALLTGAPQHQRIVFGKIGGGKSGMVRFGNYSGSMRRSSR